MQDKNLTVKELPLSERPYEKCEKMGISSLSDAELLAVVIRTGTRQLTSIDLAISILNNASIYKGLKGLNYVTRNELMQIKGIGRVKSIQIAAVVELTKRMAKETHKEGLRLITPQNVANYYMQDMRHLTREQILLVMLDSKNKVIKDLIVSKGSVNASIMPIREVFVNALKYGSVNIILIHNHPSGDPTPSREDVNVTKKVRDAGNLVGIALMDHIIIGDNRYISLKEKGFF